MQLQNQAMKTKLAMLQPLGDARPVCLSFRFRCFFVVFGYWRAQSAANAVSPGTLRQQLTRSRPRFYVIQEGRASG